MNDKTEFNNDEKLFWINVKTGERYELYDEQTAIQLNPLEYVKAQSPYRGHYFITHSIYN